MVARRAQEIKPFIVMDVLEKACELECRGEEIIHLEVGEPDFDTPNCVKAAATQAIQEGFTHYTHSLGLLELREAICDYYAKVYQVDLDPGQILVTSGSSPAIFMVFSALLEAGDQVIISDPHYACYPNFIRFVQGEPVTVPVFEDDAFQYRPEAIKEKITPRTRAVVTISPNNPTGAVYEPPLLDAVNDLCRRRGLFHIHDEAYEYFVYGGARNYSPASRPGAIS